MKLEDEIKQKKFASISQKGIVNIIYTANWLMDKHSQLLKPYKISPQQYNILRILRGQQNNPVTIQIITERMLDKMSNASRLVEKLRLKKLVSREISLKDRRQVEVLITKDGLNLLDEMDLKMAQFHKSFENIDPSLWESINNTLDNIRETNF